MTTLHLAGFPRIGAKRELKFLLENYWQGQIDEQALCNKAHANCASATGCCKRARHHAVAAGRLLLYDHVLDAQILVGAIPPRFGFDAANLSLEQYFQLARGNQQQPALEMTKWFDTNYHYLVPEWHADTRFAANPAACWPTGRGAGTGHPDQTGADRPAHPAVAGQMQGDFDRLQLLPALLQCYAQLLQILAREGVEWLQLDEPILALDLPANWLESFAPPTSNWPATAQDHAGNYFGSVARACSPAQRTAAGRSASGPGARTGTAAVFAEQWPTGQVLSAGIVDGRNIWRSNLSAQLALLEPLAGQLGDTAVAGAQLLAIALPGGCRRRNHHGCRHPQLAGLCRTKTERTETAAARTGTGPQQHRA
jgi:5-methyltetrahydropteroyltriglutamate--homocysteine methyltransferase